MTDASFKPVQNAEPAQWLVERLSTFGEDVLSIVPSGFEAYVRVFHPAEKIINTSDDSAVWPREPLLWSEVAALTGMQAHRAMQWPSLRGDCPSVQEYPPVAYGRSWLEAPTEGTLPLELAQALWPTLESFTPTRDSCFFAVWEGFGGLPRTVLDAPAFEIPARKFHLFKGPLEAIEQTFFADNIESALSGRHMTLVDPDSVTREVDGDAQVMNSDVLVVIGSNEPTAEELKEALEQLLASTEPMYQSANLWWPQDHAWCVATEIDFNTTYSTSPFSRHTSPPLSSSNVRARQPFFEWECSFPWIPAIYSRE